MQREGLMHQELDEQRLIEQERFLEGTVSVREVLVYVEQDRYLSLSEAAEYLPFCKLTISKHLREIPHFRYNRKIFFRKSELDQWAERWRVRPEDGELLDRAVELADQMLGREG